MTDASEMPELRSDNLDDFDAAPRVRDRQASWLTPVGIGVAVLIGAFVFMQLNTSRMRGQAAAQPQSPPASLAPAPPASPPVPPQQSREASSDAPTAIAANEAQARLQAPALVVDLSQPTAVTGGAAVDPNAISGALAQSLSPDERFAGRIALGSGPAHARALPHPGDTVAQGSIIAGVLETAINSDLPGYARALVTRDVRGFDGQRVLIPRGSRLIGQYRASPMQGQQRTFVIWTRLIRPDGVNVDLNSPAADALGRGGLEGVTDTHFLQRFGGAILLSLIGAAADVASSGDDTQVVIGSVRGGESAAAAALNQQLAIPPTVQVAQGTPIRVFVTRDLDFSTIAADPTP